MEWDPVKYARNERERKKLFVNFLKQLCEFNIIRLKENSLHRFFRHGIIEGSNIFEIVKRMCS